MRRSVFVLVLLVFGSVIGARGPRPEPVDHLTIDLPGLEHRVRVTTDELGVPHISGVRLGDTLRVQGYLHARDRFFQMDVNRRAATGTLAELTGDFNDLFSDPGARILGLHAAAQREEAALTPREQEVLQAYAEGVNAYLAGNPLPPEYEELEISSVPPWEILDTLLLVKGLVVQFDNRLFEIDDTETLDSYEAAGQAQGFDGNALFYEDVVRVEPMFPAATVPDAGGTIPFAAVAPNPTGASSLAHAAGAARRLRERIERIPALARFLAHPTGQVGSNVWGVAAGSSSTGAPLVANDPHQPLTAPPLGYEIHLSLRGDPVFGVRDLSGMSIPGIALFLPSGQSQDLSWGVTASQHVDVWDIFSDRLVRGDPSCPVRLCIDSAGERHPVEERSESYRRNLVGDGTLDNLQDWTAVIAFQAPQAVDVLSVPFRSFGPILEVDDRSVVSPGTSPAETTALTLQYAGLHARRDTRGVLALLTAEDIWDFRDAVKLFAGVPQNWVGADAQGNLAYFTSEEIPLRADLEAGAVVGNGPWLIRDGSGPNNWIPDPGRSQGQTLPFRVLPFDEMPQVVNPPAGFVVNANNDASGLQRDNSLVSRSRPSSPGSIYYLGWSFVPGFRAGRITLLLGQKIEAGEKISIEDMKHLQGNTQALDAELMTPFLVTAFENAQRSGAPAELLALAADPEIAEAAGRLDSWDFSTPTGIAEGYDASDVNGVRDSDVSPSEAGNSVAATIYSVWRGKVIRAVIVTRLADLGLSGFADTRTFNGLHELLSQEPFTGVGGSGVDFFPEPAALAAPDRRDVALLQALRDALDDLASNQFATAFGNSTDQDDYRWGRLHRVILEHPLGGSRSIPPAAGFQDLGPGLPGLARDGGWNTVNPGVAHPGTPFSVGVAWRLVMSPRDGRGGRAAALGFASLAGGSSGDAESPLYASQLEKWLTVDYHRVRTNPGDIRHVATKVEHFAAPRR
jgi:penicillin amidase